MITQSIRMPGFCQSFLSECAEIWLAFVERIQNKYLWIEGNSIGVSLRAMVLGDAESGATRAGAIDDITSEERSHREHEAFHLPGDRGKLPH
jgi:hypothetical protein